MLSLCESLSDVEKLDRAGGGMAVLLFYREEGLGLKIVESHVGGGGGGWRWGGGGGGVRGGGGALRPIRPKQGGQDAAVGHS